MARKIKKNKNMALSALLREEDDSSGDDNQRKRDDNNRAVERRPVNSRMRAQQMRDMARKIKKNKNMPLSALLREEDDSSGDDNQRKRDDNNRAVERRPVNSRMRAQQMRDMARKIKKNKNMPLSALLREEDDSSGDDNQRKRDDNNRAVERRPVNSRMRAQQMRDMARKIKKNKNMPLSALLREEDDSSGDDNQRKRDDNNRAVERRPVNSRMRAQTALRRLNQLRAEKKMLEEKQQILLKEFLLNLFMARAAGISQIDLSKSVHNVLLSYATSDTLENDLTKPQSS